MPLNFFYTMVQKSQKWPKTQIKGGSCLKTRWWRREGERKKERDRQLQKVSLPPLQHKASVADKTI